MPTPLLSMPTFNNALLPFASSMHASCLGAINPKRSLLHNVTGVASFSTVSPRFPVPLNLLAGLLPAKDTPRA
ncbi:MAG: hypothetical protein F6K65_08585 [Moorea sp. SIO3C2]|nr:hypothetical protein [Moorena sp. SIO3C2]